MLSQIMQSIGINSTLLTQFIIVFVMFFLGKALFFGRLQEILERREDETTGSDSKSDDELNAVNKLNEEYNSKIESANKEAMSKLSSGKTDLIKTHDKTYRAEEEKINTYIDGEIKVVEKEIEVKKGDILKEAEELSNHLIKKIIS